MMHDALFSPTATEKVYSGYLKVEEGKNNWIEYWVVIRNNQMCLFSDECSDESGEEAIKTIDLSNETRCELVKRRNYHYRFKLLLGASSFLRMKCASAFHRQQWISNIMLASAKDRVIELQPSWNTERDGVHRRTLSAESQLSSDAESEYDALGLDLSGTLSNGGIATGRESPIPIDQAKESPLNSPTIGRDSPKLASPERRGSKGILRRLSLKTTKRLRRNSRSSPRDETGSSDMGSPSPVATTPSLQHNKTVPSPKPLGEQNRVFVNPAFVPSPASSPKVARNNHVTEDVDLIDMSDF